MRHCRLPAIIALLTLLSACGAPGSTGSGSAPPRCAAPPDPRPSASTAALDPPRLSLRMVAEGFELPTAVVSPCDGTGRLFVLEKAGRIRIVNVDGSVGDAPFLDIEPKVSEPGESGLLGLAFHPQYADNGRFFIYYVDRLQQSVIAEYRVDPDDPDRADASFERTLLLIEQPDTEHKGGQLAFGPDGYLYIGLGDGGGTNDEYGNGQNPDSLLAKVLRIDVNTSPFSIPDDNPFRDGPVRPETWAWGLRNPWRFSFDPISGDLFIADVGQGRWEEIEREPAGSPGGRNYGWPLMEGGHCRLDEGCEAYDLTLPVVAYPHNGRCAVVGGHVYRGESAPLWGTYLYADYCTGTIWGFDVTAPEPMPTVLLEAEHTISSFGVDEAGELYVLDYVGGELLALAVAPSDD